MNHHVDQPGGLQGWYERSGPRGLFVLCVLAGSLALGLWATLVEVDIIVRTEGRIVPAGKSQIVQHLEGGIVRRILVQEGQMVAAGQPLMELSDIQAKSSLGQGQATVAALRGREARLMAESNGLEVLEFPSDLADDEVRTAETAAWQARRARMMEEIRVLKDQSTQKRAEMAEAENRRRNFNAELQVAQQQYKVIENLSKNGAASHLELLDGQSRVQKLNSAISEAGASIPRLRAAVSEIESKISETGARFRAEASSELTQVRTELERSSHEVSSETDRLERNVVKAPVSGFINRMSITTIGGVIRPGEVLMEITPDDDRVVVEARARPNDRANLRPGLPAKVRLGAYDYATYGSLEGKVTEVSADTLVDEREGRYYRVRVDAEKREESGKNLSILPGMTATADVVVGKRTILSYLLSPLLKFQQRVFQDPR